MKSLLGKVGVVLAGLAIFGFGGPIVNIANAQSTLALQERCTEGAKKYLESHPPIGIIGHVSHHNKTFNKCFMRVDCYYSETGWQLVQLVDAFESKLIGSRLQMKDGTLMGCYVETERCASRNEFEALIKLYMGE